MPTVAHELPLEMVRNRPQLVPQLLRTIFALEMPGEDDQITLASESYAAADPLELRCDSTVLLGFPETPDHGIVVESQMKFDPDKKYTWPAYLTLLRLRRKCDVTLLVFCPNESVARKCGTPIKLGHPNFCLEPLTIHPGLLPAITDPAKAREMPEVTIMSAPAHADGPTGTEVIQSTSVALETIPDHLRLICHDYLQACLSDAARENLEKEVQTKGYEWQSEFARIHRAQGEAESVLRVLRTRGIDVPDDICDRVTSCTDIDQLNRWLDRAVVVDHARDIFS